MEWKVMDAGAMSFESGTFDAVIEKGVFDALYAGTGEQMLRVLPEIRRVLKPNGQLLAITHDAERAARLENEASEKDAAVPVQCASTGSLSFIGRKASPDENKPGILRFIPSGVRGSPEE